MAYPNCYVVQFNPSTLKSPVHVEDSIIKAISYSMCKFSIDSVKKCSDDSDWDAVNQNLCLRQIADHEYETMIDIDGDTATVYFDLSGSIYDQYGVVYSANYVYFEAGPNFPWSEITKGDCNTSWRVDRDLVFRTVKAYGGICTPQSGCN